MTVAPAPTIIEQSPRARTVEVDFLYLDLTACSRCIGSDESLHAALDLVCPALAATGIEVALRTTLVASEEQARALHFVSSPTIRVNGRDIAATLQESACADCSNLCGCDGETNCRVWTYEGQEFTEAPVGLIVEAILGAVYGGTAPTAHAARPDEDVPDNIKRFYARKADTEQEDGDGGAVSSCCAPATQATCCGPTDKATCCGSATGGSCGCQ
jgi:Domain of unknown function (DUF2703)